MPTVDLDVGFNQGSFGATQPVFGGFDPTQAASIGFAILSDIEAFFVIEASQGDTRSNVLQAPKVTLFNGATAFVADTSQRPFVTSIIPVVGDFAAAHQPVITVLSEGTSLSVQAVVSNDRRFVRLTLVPFFSQINDVDTFTFDGVMTSDTGTNVVDPTDDTSTVIDNALATNVGTTVQLPTFSFTSVTTTVSVPDGGTILLGGIKRFKRGTHRTRRANAQQGAVYQSVVQECRDRSRDSKPDDDGDAADYYPGRGRRTVGAGPSLVAAGGSTVWLSSGIDFEGSA